MKKLIALLLALVMVIGMVACGDANEPAETKAPAAEVPGDDAPATEAPTEAVAKDPVTLVWRYPCYSSDIPDMQIVEDAFNEKVKTYPGLEHVTVDLVPINYGEHAEQTMLAQTAGEQIDILQTFMLSLPTEVTNGTFIDMSEYVTDQMKSELPEYLLDLGKIDGAQYIIPCNQIAVTQQYFITPVEYMDSCGDLDAWRKTLQDPNVTMADFEALATDYVAAVAEAYPEKTVYGMPMGLYIFDTGRGLFASVEHVGGANDFFVRKDSTTIEFIAQTQEYKDAIAMAANWNSKGLLSDDPDFTDMDIRLENMMNEVCAAFSFECGVGDEAQASEKFSAQFGFDVYAIPMITDGFLVPSQWGAGGNGITASCENPEEAARLLEVMNTVEGKELYNLAVYGIEGTHWDFTGDNTIQTYEYDGDMAWGGNYGGWKWILGNALNAYQNQGCIPGELDIVVEMNNAEGNVGSPFTGMIFDLVPVEVELSNVAAIFAEYEDLLAKGLMGTPDAATAKYDEMMGRLEEAGLQTILDELQAQLDAHLAS